MYIYKEREREREREGEREINCATTSEFLVNMMHVHLVDKTFYLPVCIPKR